MITGDTFLSLFALIASRLCILISVNFLFALREVISLNKEEGEGCYSERLETLGRLAELASGELRGFRVAY